MAAQACGGDRFWSRSAESLPGALESSTGTLSPADSVLLEAGGLGRRTIAGGDVDSTLTCVERESS